MRAPVALVLLLLLGLSDQALAHRAHWHNHIVKVAKTTHSWGDPRPYAWCGWWMRHLLGVADRSFNLALRWIHWGHATYPHAGAVVVWSHGGGHGHVGIIRGGPDASGRYLIESGNDGHAVRTRYRSIAGAVAVRI